MDRQQRKSQQNLDRSGWALVDSKCRVGAVCDHHPHHTCQADGPAPSNEIWTVPFLPGLLIAWLIAFLCTPVSFPRFVCLLVFLSFYPGGKAIEGLRPALDTLTTTMYQKVLFISTCNPSVLARANFVLSCDSCSLCLLLCL